MNLGNWQLDSVSGGQFWIDGGVMFGVVPKSLWSQVTLADEQNRVRCANNCVLARDGKHTVLIDTGYGGRYSPLDRRFYVMEDGEPLITSLSSMGVSPEDVDTVVFSHLHFDHVGGAARFDTNGQAAVTFANARHVAGRIEWDDATGGAAELQTAYMPWQLEPLKHSGLLELIEGDAEIVPGLRSRITGGHTRGHLALLFESNGATAVYLGDLCPSTMHLRRMWHTAYDVFPLETRRRKPAWLAEAADNDWHVLWNHDPQTAVSRVQRHPKREFVPVDARPYL
jgi:glyoxylase-like metal-dependent hydrolase (beta-lactamase superfamily II)